MAPSLPGDIFQAHAKKLAAVSISRVISYVFNINANANKLDKPEQGPGSVPMMGTTVAALTHPSIPPEEKTAESTWE